MTEKDIIKLNGSIVEPQTVRDIHESGIPIGYEPEQKSSVHKNRNVHIFILESGQEILVYTRRPEK